MGRNMRSHITALTPEIVDEEKPVRVCVWGGGVNAFDLEVTSQLLRIIVETWGATVQQFFYFDKHVWETAFFVFQSRIWGHNAGNSDTSHTCLWASKTFKMAVWVSRGRLFYNEDLPKCGEKFVVLWEHVYKRCLLEAGCKYRLIILIEALNVSD